MPTDSSPQWDLKEHSRYSQDDGDNLVKGSDLRNTMIAGWAAPVHQPQRVKWTDGTMIYAKYSQSYITISSPSLFQNGVENYDLRCIFSEKPC